MKWVKRIFYFFLVTYVIGVGVLFFFQESLLFRPYHLDENHQYRRGIEIEIPVTDGISLNCVSIKPANSKGAILYLHGNKGNLRRCIRQVECFDGLGYEIFIPDYRSYGKSEGKLQSEELMISDIQKVYDHLRKTYAENQIHLVGYSMGSGVATRIAHENKPGSLYLIAPFVSLTWMKDQYMPLIPDFIMRFQFKTYEYLPSIKCPITLIHGTADRVVPYKCSEILKKIDPERITLHSFEGASHRSTILNYELRSIFENNL